jgi:1-acyl-sn-glycerol-3-phosphate acyltransferase
MLNFLPAPFIGVIAAILYVLSITLWVALLFFAGILRFILPNKRWRNFLTYVMNQMPAYWADTNHAIQWLTTKIEWDVKGLDGLNYNDWYLIMSNHQSYADILILQNICKHKIPMPKFFMKKELLWSLPIASWACWLLDFPFMYRHGKAALAKNPALKGQDVATTKKACEKFKELPTTVINFVEGTRFTAKKQQQQQSPYQYLLRPKAGGIAFALATLGEQFHKIINVTIIYPTANINAWDFICGKAKKIIVRAEVLPITPALMGDYENSRDFRVQFQSWLNQLWQQKDELIKQEYSKDKLI